MYWDPKPTHRGRAKIVGAAAPLGPALELPRVSHCAAAGAVAVAVVGDVVERRSTAGHEGDPVRAPVTARAASAFVDGRLGGCHRAAAGTDPTRYPAAASVVAGSGSAAVGFEAVASVAGIEAAVSAVEAAQVALAACSSAGGA